MAEFIRLKKSNCKNCYKCIRNCPVKSIRFSANQAHIVGNECILCGNCFVVCPQEAKEVLDCREKAKVLLMQGQQIVASVAPSFVANYPGVGIKALEKALKQLGFFAVEETAIGATMVKKEYEHILKEHQPSVLISSCCHSVNLLIQKHYPECLRYLAKVVSPMQAHCKDIKKRYPEAKTIFIGPCIAKKDEADYYKDYVDGVLTFTELDELLEEKGIVLEQEMDGLEESKARLFPTTGGILDTMEKDEEHYSYVAVDGAEDCIAALKEIQEGKIENCFIEMSICEGSCVGGPIMQKRNKAPLLDYIQVKRYAGEKDFVLTTQPTQQDMVKHFTFIERKLGMPSETEICTILRQMGKMKPAQELNCGSCGYNTCREKAVAIYQGKADLTMCMPFLKDRAESFSDNIIKNTPNGIIVLNENLEVQQINTAACKILNLDRATDILGEPVVRILDPLEFIQVKESATNQYDKRVYLAEYKKYVDETIIFDREFRILICMMRDVSLQEQQREKREFIVHKTVEIADNVVDKQMRIVQEIASLLGETAAETKIALTKLKQTIAKESSSDE